MKKIFKCEDSYDWEMKVKDEVSPVYFNVHKILGIGLNILVPFLLLFVLKVNIITLLLCFVAFDAGMLVLDYCSIGIYKLFKSLTWMPKKAQFIKKVNGMSVDEVKALKKELDTHSKFYVAKLEIINQRIEEYKKLDSVTTPDEHRNTIKYVQEMIEKMRAYSDDNIPFEYCEKCIKWIQNYVKKIVKKSDKLLEIIKEDPDSIVQIVNIYNVYAEELLRIILKYQEADDEQQENMRPKLEKLLTTFCDKIDRMIEKITASKEHSLNTDIDYLTKRLSEDANQKENAE